MANGEFQQFNVQVMACTSDGGNSSELFRSPTNRSVGLHHKATMNGHFNTELI